jgi:2-hydroxymuconate-semialdehyde hydrolase
MVTIWLPNGNRWVTISQAPTHPGILPAVDRSARGSDVIRSLQLSDAGIELDDLGEGSAVLLLHGFPTTRQLWSQVAPALAQRGYRVIVPDLVGYGSSKAHAGVSVDMASQARWMWQLLDGLHVQRVIIIAHDVGSAAAQLMTVTQPARVRGLAILDGVYRTEWAMGAIESIRSWDVAEVHRLLPVLIRRLGKSPRMREILNAYAGEEAGKRLIQAARDLDPRQTADIGGSLQASRVPALVLWGRDDHYLEIDAVARPLAELLKAPLSILPGGHFTPVDCPREVSAALCDFVDSIDKL